MYNKGLLKTEMRMMVMMMMSYDDQAGQDGNIETDTTTHNLTHTDHYIEILINSFLKNGQLFWVL